MPGIDKIMAKFIRGGGKTLRSEIQIIIIFLFSNQAWSDMRKMSGEYNLLYADDLSSGMLCLLVS